MFFMRMGQMRRTMFLFRKKLRQGQVLEFFSARPVCTVVMEACGGAHYWAWEIDKP